ncbi:MAG: hypothetical protein Q8Q00_14110 [Dehalococcoidia bacterium]|nr:hypothetical protein [Dehalococcoidia bacterium]
MPKKSRRRKRQRSLVGRPAGTPAAAPVATGASRRISWPGLIGALLGFAPMFAIAIGVLVDPGEANRALVVVPLLMAALFIPAAWASLAATDQRRAILRGSAAASIIMSFAGAALLGPPALLALLPATVLLWLASGGARR